MRANNGYEYKVLKVRALGWGRNKATERAVAKAASEGWEVISTALIPGVVTVPVVTLRRLTRLPA